MGRKRCILGIFPSFIVKNAHNLQPLKGGCKFVFLFSSFSLLLPFSALFFLFSSASINLKASKLPTNWGVRHITMWWFWPYWYTNPHMEPGQGVAFAPAVVSPQGESGGDPPASSLVPAFHGRRRARRGGQSLSTSCPKCCKKLLCVYPPPPGKYYENNSPRIFLCNFWGRLRQNCVITRKLIPQELFCVIGDRRHLRLVHVELREIYVTPGKIILR